MTLKAYRRRPAPEPVGPLLKSWLDLETANLKAAIDDAQTGASGVTAGTYGDATHVPQVTVDASGRITAASNVAIASGPTTVVLSADVSNSVAATNQATGLTASVATGTTYLFRWTLFVSSNTNTGGLTLKITHPTYTASLLHVRGNSTSAASFTDGEPAIGASPSSIGTAYVAYSGTGIVIIEHRIVPSASGSVDVTFNPTVNGQNYTIQAGSVLEVFSA